MMTCTVATPRPDGDSMIDRMRKLAAAMDDAERRLAPYRAPRVIKLHPDDYKALREQVEPMLTQPAPGAADSFGGVPVVIDEAAPRLPRKA